MLTTRSESVSSRALSTEERRFYFEWALLATLVLASFTLAASMQWAQWFGFSLYDQFQRWFPAKPSNDIVLVVIDDETLDARGGWPLKRADYAQILKMWTYSGMHPRALGIDLLFLDATPEDTEFALAMTGHNVVLAFEKRKPETTPLAFPSNSAFTNAAVTLAHINLSFDPDGSIRGAHLLDNSVPQISLAMSGRQYGEYETDNSYRRFRLVDPSVGFPTASLSDVIDGKVPLQFFKDKYVLIGATAPSLGDHFPTVYSGDHASGMPGVILHANLLNAILRDELIRPVPLSVQLLLNAISILLAMTALLVLSPLAELMANLLLALTALLTSCALFLWGHYWFDPSLAVMAIVVAKASWAWRRNEMIIHFMASRASQLDRERGLLHEAQRLVPRRQLASDTVFRYSRLLDAAVDSASKQLSFLESIVSKLPIAVVVADAGGNIVLSNPKGQSELPAELVQPGFNVHGLLNHLALSQQGLSELTEQERVVHSQAPAGARSFILRVAQVFRPDGSPLWVMSLADVTEMRQFQVERENTLQLLSHDMRTPIAAIIALNRTKAVGQRVDTRAAAEIARHSSKLLDMMDDFIYSIHAQAAEYVWDALLFENLLDDAIFQVKELATAQGCSLVQQLEESPDFVRADSRLLTRALVNLLVNAIRYGEQGGTIAIQVSRELGADSQLWVRCRVSNRVGDSKASPGRSHGSGASFGLGLGFVQTVIQKHRGQFSTQLSSKAGELAVVEVALPVFVA